MNIPFGTETVTLYHKTDKGYTRIVLHGCSWSTRISRSLYDNVQRNGSAECICRWSPDQPKAGTGDLLIRGEIYDKLTSGVQIAGLLEQYAATGAFICNTFHDNVVGICPLKHYCARGEVYGT